MGRRQSEADYIRVPNPTPVFAVPQPAPTPVALVPPVEPPSPPTPPDATSDLPFPDSPRTCMLAAPGGYGPGPPPVGAAAGPTYTSRSPEIKCPGLHPAAVFGYPPSFSHGATAAAGNGLGRYPPQPLVYRRPSFRYRGPPVVHAAPAPTPTQLPWDTAASGPYGIHGATAVHGDQGLFSAT